MEQEHCQPCHILVAFAYPQRSQSAEPPEVSEAAERIQEA